MLWYLRALLGWDPSPLPALQAEALESWNERNLEHRNLAGSAPPACQGPHAGGRFMFLNCLHLRDSDTGKMDFSFLSCYPEWAKAGNAGDLVWVLPRNQHYEGEMVMTPRVRFYPNSLCERRHQADAHLQPCLDPGLLHVQSGCHEHNLKLTGGKEPLNPARHISLLFIFHSAPKPTFWKAGRSGSVLTCARLSG